MEEGQWVRVRPGLHHRNVELQGGDVFFASPAELLAFGDKFEPAEPPAGVPVGWSALVKIAGDHEESGAVALGDLPGLDGAVEVEMTTAALLLATKHKLDLTMLDGTGKGGRVILNDVRKAIELMEE